MDYKNHMKIKGFTPTPKFTKKVILVSGFTLVELMVVISIFLLISAVTVFNYTDFRSNVSLQNLTDEIALSIRKAQSYAIGARGLDNAGTVDFNNSYGMHFTIDPSPNKGIQEGSYKSFILFYSADDKNYDANSTGTCGDMITNECRELFNITTTDIIKEIKIDGTTMNAQKASLDIVFKRPDPRAYFCYRASNTSNGNCDNQNISAVSIVVSNGQTSNGEEKTKTISVQNTGQISIQ